MFDSRSKKNYNVKCYKLSWKNYKEKHESNNHKNVDRKTFWSGAKG